jgi:hypothetical protein
VREYVRPVILDDDHDADAGADRAGSTDTAPSWNRQERYRHVDTVAQALIEHVAREYEVVVDAPVALPALHARWLGHDVSRIVRISPMRPGEVTVHVVFGPDPGVISVFAGLVSQFDLWFCGCDACDEPWQDVADATEQVVLGLARGGVAERLVPGRLGRPRIARFALTKPRATWSGTVPTRGASRRELRRWQGELAGLTDGRWSGWTRRSAEPGR